VCLIIRKIIHQYKQNKQSPFTSNHKELLTLTEHRSSPPVFSRVRVTQSLVLYVCFVDRCLSFCTSSFGHCVVCSSSIYLFPQCGILELFPVWYFRSVPTVWYFRTVPTVCYFRTVPTVWYFRTVPTVIVSFICMFCRSLFVLLYFFFWSLCCLFFFDIRILITSLWYLQTLLIIK
jgi:hypothetical protein